MTLKIAVLLQVLTSAAAADPSGTLATQIKKIDDTHYVVAREALDFLWGDLEMGEAPRWSAGAVPELRGDRGVGLKLPDIGPDSVAARVGFRSGDLVEFVNGLPLTWPETVFDAYAKTRDDSKLTFAVTRAEKRISIVWQVSGPVASRASIADGGEAEQWSKKIVSQTARVDDTHYTIKRRAFEGLIRGAALLAPSCRIVPDMREGRPVGFRLYSLRPGSVLAALGFVTGDLVRAINGVELTSPEAAQKIARTRGRPRSYRVSVERSGEPVMLEITVR